MTYLLLMHELVFVLGQVAIDFLNERFRIALVVIVHAIVVSVILIFASGMESAASGDYQIQAELEKRPGKNAQREVGHDCRGLDVFFV